MTKRLTVQNASITTAAVEVKTLTISGKQVTLAVFRQLREEPLIADDGTLNGQPWGYVNYHPDKCGDDSPHWHVVWQQGDELLRSAIDKTPRFDRRNSITGSLTSAHEHKSVTGDRFLSALVYMGLRSGGDIVLDKNNLSSRGGNTMLLGDDITGSIGFQVRATACPEAMTAAEAGVRLAAAEAMAARPLSDYEKQQRDDWQQRVLQDRQSSLTAAQEKFETALGALRELIERWGGFDDINDQYAAELEQERVRRQQHRQARAAIADLPQLFIAV